MRRQKKGGFYALWDLDENTGTTGGLILGKCRYPRTANIKERPYIPGFKEEGKSEGWKVKEEKKALSAAGRPKRGKGGF